MTGLKVQGTSTAAWGHKLTSGLEDPSKVIKVLASDGSNGEQRELAYTGCRVIGNGSFGVVFQARLVRYTPDGHEVPPSEITDGSDSVAIKKVLQDKRFKVRRPSFSSAHTEP